MPQSSFVLRRQAELVRALRNPRHTLDLAKASGLQGGAGRPQRPVWAKAAHTTIHGQCLALDVRESTLWVLVRTASGEEAWAPAVRILSPEDRRRWAREGFG